MHAETHSAQECCGFVGALYPCLVSCAGSASVWAPELMVSRFLDPQGAECCMFRSSCRHFATLRLCLHSLKLVCCCTIRGPGVRLEAHQIKHLGGLQCSTVFSPNGPNAELGPCVDRNLITSPLPSVSPDAPRGTCHQTSFRQVVFAFSIWTEAACSHRCAFMIQRYPWMHANVLDLQSYRSVRLSILTCQIRSSALIQRCNPPSWIASQGSWRNKPLTPLR